MEKHLDIMEGQTNNVPKMTRRYFWPIPFGFPMYDPYNTGPMSEPILSPAGGIVAPRRNPYYPKPTNPFLNPYTTQYRMSLGPMAPYAMPRGPMGGLRPPGGMTPGGIMPPPPGGMRPMGPPPMGPMGPPPMGPMGPPPIGPRPF